MGSLAQQANPGVNLDPEQPGWGRRVSKVINNLLVGKLNNTGNMTLNSGAVSTTVSDARVGPNSVILLMPTSATGSISLDQWRIQTRTDGSFTVTHTSTSTSDCTASYALLG
jgi:hypothetical protein